MSIVNQINLTILVIRFVHLVMNIANPYSHILLDNMICKLSSYFLTSTTRIIYWLSSLIAIERIYVTLFLNGRWLKKPRIARCLILVTIITVLLVTGYELHFMQSQVSSDDGTHSMCVFNFPVKYSYWKEHHKIVSIINPLIPFLINLCCTIGIIYIVTKKKMNANVRSVRK